jgi:transcriptional regulator with XRE-family HTH domain
MKQLGQRIRRAREQAQLSQEEFAALIHRDQRAVSLYENGVRKVAATDLARFAEVLNVPPAYFYGDNLFKDDLDELLLHEFHKLPSPELKEIAIEVVRLVLRTANTSR